MYTYIIESQEYYKIGKAVNIDNRLITYNTHNPIFELVHTFGFDCECFLHEYFKIKRFKFEWFSLSTEDILWIKNNENICFENSYEELIRKSGIKTRERLKNKEINELIKNKQLRIEEQKINIEQMKNFQENYGYKGPMKHIFTENEFFEHDKNLLN